ncbi:MAG TPA: hypothetical protein VN706_17075 [Gemmatimonadaceae bacterium]|nr:hypothetical protein [Gemmatimonadaceae bacterium]
MAAHVEKDSVELVFEFLDDPVCATTQRRGCGAPYFPVSGGRLGIPSADAVYMVYFAANTLAAKANRNQQNRFNQQLVDDVTSMGGGLPSEATIIAGISDFIVQRAKDELVISFFADLRERLKNDAVLRLLFASTYTAMANLDAVAASQLVPTLRAAFRADVQALPVNALDPDLVGDIVAELKDPVASAAWPTAKPWVHDAHSIAMRLHGLTDGEPTLAALAHLAELQTTDIVDDRLRAALVTGGIMAREYRNGGAELLQAVRTDPYERQLAVGVLLRELIDSQALPQSVVTDGLVKNYVARIAPLGMALADVDTAVRNGVERLKAAGSGDAALGVAAQITAAAVQFVGAVAPLVGDANAQHQVQGVLDLLSDLSHAEAAIAAQEYVTAAQTLVSALARQLSTPVFSPQRVRILSFASALASAKTPADVSSALNAAAVPVTSFRTKRARTGTDASFAFGINSYVGAVAGVENAFGPGSNQGAAGYAGAVVPVGFELSWPFGRSNGSLSLFVPLIDLGTVASYRFGKDAASADAVPHVTFAQIVAPGAYAVFGITQRYPISVGLGAQYVGGLRKNELTGARMNVARGGAFVAVDVPLFRF